MQVILLLKLLAIPFYPLGCSLVLIMAGLLLLRLRRKHGPLLIAIGTALLYILATPFVSRLLIRLLEEPYFNLEALPRDCSAIVVLGGGGIPMGPQRKYPEVSEAGDRLLHAARLYKDGIAPRVITSGGMVAGALKKTLSEGEHNAMILREIGVDSNAIIIENMARITADHGPYIAAILDSLNLPKRIVLVTSAAHMNRSLAVFKKHGFTTYPAATDFQSTPCFLEDIRDFFPSAGALYTTTSAAHEYYGILGYKILGKI